MAVYERVGRFNDRFDRVGLVRAVWVPFVAALITAGVLGWLAPLRGSLHSVSLLPGPLALQTAGFDPVFVVATMGIGLTGLYLTAMPTALLAVGGLCCLLGGGRLWTVAVGLLCGVLAAATLTTLSGCHCGAGSTMPLWRSAANMLAIGPF
jgi:hypothetical protein